MDARDCWLALYLISGVGKATFYKLLGFFESPQEVLHASESSLAECGFLTPLIIGRILEGNHEQRLAQEKELMQENNVKFLTFRCPEYPETLKDISDPPPVLYYKGELKKEDQLAIAIVGTRYPSHYAKQMAFNLAHDLAGLGLTIISGLARGIDTAAHQGALSAGGRTFAVLGCGLDVIYPKENEKLYAEIIENGCLLTEFPMKTPPEKGNFPIRNRLISGLSKGVLIAEAPSDSGALITAEYAVNQGREVFALPGLVTNAKSKGCHQLIKEGAKLVETAQDVIEEIAPHLISVSLGEVQEKRQNLEQMSLLEQEIYALLSFEPQHIDDVLAQSKQSISKLSAILSELEIKNIVKQLPGKVFVRI